MPFAVLIEAINLARCHDSGITIIMKLFVGVTNNEWFRFLAARNPDEVNFWRPRSQMDFKALKTGDIFLFKLHSPLDVIAGGGVFLKHTFLPLRLAWQSFGERNGTPDLDTFEKRILEHRAPDELTRNLGCTILVQPFFWPKERWIPIPSDWSKNIVAGKGYSIETPTGAALWANVRARISSDVVPATVDAEPQDRYGAPVSIRPRLGQGAFRIEVTDAYSRKCAITGEKTLPALEAGHIRPYSKDGPHEVRNGLLLRSDLHNLFDEGYLTVTLDYRVEVSRRIREEFENGRHYYDLHGKRLAMIPSAEDSRPAREFLEWHHGLFKG
ncbi:MAG: HNH endonuclease [Candidatus Didemnitutus sp.]|nr:HNH endonuclease [Candidatus Didemnitutus sp.]